MIGNNDFSKYKKKLYLRNYEIPLPSFTFYLVYYYRGLLFTAVVLLKLN